MTDADPVVHFVVPHFGDPEYLRLAVTSVLTQADPAWLLTVVEDGRVTSEVEDWITSLNDGRVAYECNPQRLGINGNFQRALDLSAAPYVVFLGCDDVLLANYVACVRELTREHPDVSVIQPGVRVIDALGALTRPIGDRVKHQLRPRVRNAERLSGENLVASLLHGNWTYFPSLCWKRDAIAGFGFRQDLPTTLDLALLLDVLFAGGSFLLADEVAFEYRRHAESASSLAARSADRFAEESRVFAEAESRSRAAGWPRAARAARWHVTSRLHAGLVLARAVLSWDMASARPATRHVVRSPRSVPA
jgi:glycosyltransferase involved in cell wall biosynthesis